jgi:hypothetical protein
MKEQLTKQEPGSITVMRQSSVCLNLLPVCRTEPGTITNERSKIIDEAFIFSIQSRSGCEEPDEEHGDQNKNNRARVFTVTGQMG